MRGEGADLSFLLDSKMFSASLLCKVFAAHCGAVKIFTALSDLSIATRLGGSNKWN